jgi:hypothetical protein
LHSISQREASLAKQNGSSRHESFMNQLKQNAEIIGNGGNAALTTGDARFDAKLNDGFKALIQSHKRNGKETNANSESESADCSNETNAVAGPIINQRSESATSNETSATEPLSEASYPTVQSSRADQPSNQPTVPAKQPSSTPKPSRQKKRKSPSQTVALKLVDAGHWRCPICTFNNERNTTSGARCEMCNTARPENKTEIVNIDC